jgi:hypothetical protein
MHCIGKAEMERKVDFEKKGKKVKVGKVNPGQEIVN